MSKDDTDKFLAMSDVMRESIKSVAIGMVSGMTARFSGWPIEKIWYGMQEKRTPFRTVLQETWSHRSLIKNSFKQAGLRQSILQPAAYMGIINLFFREEEGGFKKLNALLAAKAIVCSSFCESLVTTDQERKKASLFSGKKFTYYSLFSPQNARSFSITVVKNLSVNSLTIPITLGMSQTIKENIKTQSPFFKVLTYIVSAYIASAATQVIGVPIVNIQNRVFRNPNKPISYHTKSAFNSGLANLYKGGLVRFFHQGSLGAIAFSLTVILDDLFSNSQKDESDSDYTMHA